MVRINPFNKEKKPDPSNIPTEQFKEAAIRKSFIDSAVGDDIDDLKEKKNKHESKRNKLAAGAAVTGAIGVVFPPLFLVAAVLGAFAIKEQRVASKANSEKNELKSLKKSTTKSLLDAAKGGEEASKEKDPKLTREKERAERFAKEAKEAEKEAEKEVRKAEKKAEKKANKKARKEYKSAKKDNRQSNELDKKERKKSHEKNIGEVSKFADRDDIIKEKDGNFDLGSEIRELSNKLSENNDPKKKGTRSDKDVRAQNLEYISETLLSQIGDDLKVVIKDDIIKNYDGKDDVGSITKYIEQTDLFKQADQGKSKQNSLKKQVVESVKEVSEEAKFVDKHRVPKTLRRAEKDDLRQEAGLSAKVKPQSFMSKAKNAINAPPPGARIDRPFHNTQNGPNDGLSK